MHELLLYSPDRATLADRALVWAVRLVGGGPAFGLDSDGSVLAARDIGSADAASLSKRFSYLSVDGRGDGHAPWRAGPSPVVPPAPAPGRRRNAIIPARPDPLF